MELNLDLIDQALEYRASAFVRCKLVKALFQDQRHPLIWMDIPDERANRAHLFSTLVAVEDDFGEISVPIPTILMASTDPLYEIYRFAFNCGFIPVFRAKHRFCEAVVVPSENDAVMMAGFIDLLTEQVKTEFTTDETAEFGRAFKRGSGFGTKF